MNRVNELFFESGKNIIPKGGGWVVIKGNPYAARGLRIPESIRAEGVRHMDIYYAYDEEVPWKVPSKVLKEFGLLKKDFSGVDADEFFLYLAAINNIPTLQLSWLTLHTPSSQLIRMYRGEVAHFSQELIDELLNSGGVRIVQFGGEQIEPVWEEATRDLVDALQLDGLNYHEAQAELLRAGDVDFEFHQRKPMYFYRATGWYYDMLSEEPDYEYWRKNNG